MPSKSQTKLEKLAYAFAEAKAKADSAKKDSDEIRDQLIDLAGIGAEIEIETDLGPRVVKIDEQTQTRLDTERLKIERPEIVELFSKPSIFTTVKIVKKT